MILLFIVNFSPINENRRKIFQIHNTRGFSSLWETKPIIIHFNGFLHAIDFLASQPIKVACYLLLVKNDLFPKNLWQRSKTKHKFAYLHCGVLDCEGFTTIIVKFLSSFVEQDEVKIIHGLYIRVKNFGVHPKLAKGFEKCNIPYVIKMLSTTTIDNILPFHPPLVPTLYNEHNIKKFQNWFQESWPSTKKNCCCNGH